MDLAAAAAAAGIQVQDNQIQINEAQLQQLLQAAAPAPAAAPAAAAPAAAPVRMGKKLPPFSSATGSEWLVWRKTFNMVRRINDWDDLRARREAATAMEGEAGRVCRDVDPEPQNNPGFTINDLLGVYENKFLPPMESDLAVSTFDAASQGPKETPILWGARVKELYLRAYPNNEVDNRICINRFVCGLKDRDVAMYVHEQRPQTFEAASQHALSKTASKQFMQSQWTGRGGGRGDRDIGSIGEMGAVRNRDNRNQKRNGQGNNNRNMACWFCGDRRHVRKDCEAYNAAVKAVRNKNKDQGGKENIGEVAGNA